MDLEEQTSSALGMTKYMCSVTACTKKNICSQVQHESPYSVLQRRTSTNFIQNIVATPPSQIATSTSSHSTRSPPAVLDNLPKPSHACVGDIVVACENTSTIEEGYLKVEISETCQVLYVGSQATQDDAWYFVESIKPSQQVGSLRRSC